MIQWQRDHQGQPSEAQACRATAGNARRRLARSAARPMRWIGRPAGRGFTLIELLVALVIGLFLLTGIITVFLANQNAYRLKTDLDAAQDAFRFAHFTVTRLVRAADEYEILPGDGDDDVLRLTLRPGALEAGVFGCDGASELPDPSTIELRRVGGELRCSSDAVVEGLGRFSVAAFGSEGQAVQVTLEMQRDAASQQAQQARLETRFVASLRNRIVGRSAP